MSILVDSGLGRLADAVLAGATRELRSAHRYLVRRAVAVESLLAGRPAWNDYLQCKIAYSRWRSAREFFLRDSKTSMLPVFAEITGYAPDTVRERVASYMSLPWNGRAIAKALTEYNRSNKAALRLARSAPPREGSTYAPKVIREIEEFRKLGHSWQWIGKKLGVDASNARKAFTKYA